MTGRILASGLLQAFGLDALLALALLAIGTSVYRLAPDLVWGFGGLVLLVLWWAIGAAAAKEKAAKGPQG